MSFIRGLFVVLALLAAVAFAVASGFLLAQVYENDSIAGRLRTAFGWTDDETVKNSALAATISAAGAIVLLTLLAANVV